MAVERIPRHPDFAGLEGAVAGPRAASGSAQVPEYLGHVTARQKDRANILKQQRPRGGPQAPFGQGRGQDG